MLSPFASRRVNSAKHRALLFVGGKVQSEILRSAQNDSMADECTNVRLNNVVYTRSPKRQEEGVR